MEKAADAELAKDGRSLIVNCHSFPSKPLPYEHDQSIGRPDICIGTDDFHTPKRLFHAIREVFEKSGFRVDRNRPFAGTIVPMKHYRKNQNVKSVMIEIHRKLYMDKSTGNRSADYAQFADTFQKSLEEIYKKAWNQIAR